MKNLEDLQRQFLDETRTCTSGGDVEAVRLKYLGRKGLLAQVRQGVDFKTMTPEERASFGKGFNELKDLMEHSVDDLQRTAKSTTVSRGPSLDKTLPGSGKSIGSLHPITLVQLELEEIFKSMGFTIETDSKWRLSSIIFDALNTPFDHPAREMQDTFWLTNGMLLPDPDLGEPGTSPGEIRCAHEDDRTGKMFPL